MVVARDIARAGRLAKAWISASSLSSFRAIQQYEHLCTTSQLHLALANKLITTTWMVFALSIEAHVESGKGS